MDRLSLSLAGALLLWTTGASAFVSPSPPPGFGGAAGAWTWTPPTAAQQIGGIMRGPGPSLAGEASTAAFRVGGGAARALAGRAVAGLIPGVGAALAIAWLASQCFERQDGQWVRTCGPGLVQSSGQEFQVSNGYGATSGWHATRELACIAAKPNGGRVEFNASNNFCYGYDQNGSYVFGSGFQIRTSSCPAGWYVTPAGCVQQRPVQTVTPQQIEDEMATKPLPQTLPPGVPYPLDPLSPTIFNPTTANPPVSQPLRTPQGNPIPIPDTNPQQYRQPVTRWTHSPTATDPWRLDARPEDIVSNSPTGMTGPESVTSGSPSGKPPEKSDFCAEHPDVLACQKVKLDPIDPVVVMGKDKNLAIVPDAGWGPGAAGCPPDRTASLSFGPIAFSYQPFCQFAAGIRPVVVALAWLIAAGSFFGFARRD